jgi:hypothetical protein
LDLCFLRWCPSGGVVWPPLSMVIGLTTLCSIATSP